MLQTDDRTFRGRINCVLSYLKTNYPTKQIILLTPIHRGYAKFGDNNIQPDESYPNGIGLYVDEYVKAIKEAANVWAVPVIDLNSISGFILSSTPIPVIFIGKIRTAFIRMRTGITGWQRL